MKDLGRFLSRPRSDIQRAVALVIMCLGLTAAAARGEIYVDASCGDDAKAGTSPNCADADGPKLTIQAAMDAAVAGDEVIVAQGTYSELIDFLGKAITVRSTDPSDSAVVAATVIDGTGLGSSVVTCATAEGPDTVLSGVTITGGSAQYGGGMHNSGSSPTVTDCVLTGNHAAGPTDNAGGGMYNESSSPTATRCIFLENDASAGDFGTSAGGGMYNLNSSPTVTECRFVANQVYGGYFGGGGTGGGMCNINSSATVTDSTFSGNLADGPGGGIVNDGGSATVIRCTFSGNSANNCGGMQNSGSTTVANCRLAGNSGYYYGGGMCNSGGTTVTNCIMSGNTASNYGGGMYNSGSPFVANCTFSRNYAYQGGAIYNGYGSTPTLANSILWGSAFNEVNAAPTIAHCNLQGTLPTGSIDGGGNIQASPLFVDPDGLDDMVGTEDDNLRLTFGSPCIDVGDNSAVPAGITTDLDGNPRILAVTSPIVDMGAYEFESDCNENGLTDDCDLDCSARDGACGVAGCGQSQDCSANGVPDECEPDTDCNTNGIRDICEIGAGTSQDCNGNLLPDECEDCDGNGLADSCDLDQGAPDCNNNAHPDSCDIADDTSTDCNNNGIPDECDVQAEAFNADTTSTSETAAAYPDLIFVDNDPAEDTIVSAGLLEFGPQGRVSSPYESAGPLKVTFGYGAIDNNTGQNVEVSVYGVTFLFHPGYPQGAFGGCGGPLLNMGFTPAVDVLHHWTIQTDGAGNFHITVVDGLGGEATFHCSKYYSGATSGTVEFFDGGGRRAILDDIAVERNDSVDCNANGIVDECENDCNCNGIDDSVDIASCAGDPACSDCNGNQVPDGCDLAAGWILNPATGNYYGLSTNTTWPNAEAEAVASGGHLVAIGGVAENRWLAETFPNRLREQFWIGLTDAPHEGWWVWSNGEPEVYYNWASGEPNNAGGNEDYAEMYAGGQWNDASGTRSGIIELTRSPIDCNGNLIPDECEVDCNCNGIDDASEIAGCTGDPSCGDCNGNGVPDECDLTDNTSADCNSNLIPDQCEIADGASTDCNGNDVPDECEALPSPFQACSNDFSAAADGAGGERLSRFGCVEAPEPPAAGAGCTAVRVVLRTLYNTSAGDPDGASVCPDRALLTTPQPALSQFEGQTRWLGAPVEALDEATPPAADYLAAPLVCTAAEAELRDWSAAGLGASFDDGTNATRVYFYDSVVMPCSVYEVAHCSDPLDESTCSSPVLIFTSRMADAWPPFDVLGQPSFSDINAEVNKYKSIPFTPGDPPQGGPPEWHSLLKGNVVADYNVSVVNKKVGFLDIGMAVDGFKGIPYKEPGPCDAGTGFDNCGNACSTAP